MRKRRLLLRTVLFMALIMLFQTFLPVYAYTDEDLLTITVTEDGYKSSGSFFKGNDPLYPGCKPVSNTLLIKNECGKEIKIEKIGMEISLSKNNISISNEHADAKDFLKYVKIKLEYKSFLSRVLKGTIYDGDLAGLLEGGNCSIGIGKDKTIELRYSMTMDDQASDNIENMSASIEYTIGLSE